MGNRVRNLLLLGMLVAPLVSIAVARNAPFTTFDGRTTTVSESLAENKWTLVMIWASDCPICNAEAPAINALHRKHRDSDLRVLGVSLDGGVSETAAREFVSKHAIVFPNLMTTYAAGTRLYEEETGESFYGTPTFLLYGPDGKVKAKNVGRLPVTAVEQFISANATPDS